jgi:Zn-dependent protease with chaperone function
MKKKHTFVDCLFAGLPALFVIAIIRFFSQMSQECFISLVLILAASCATVFITAAMGRLVFFLMELTEKKAVEKHE